MSSPVDRGEQSLAAYLLKILTLLVKQHNGEIRIDATDMMDDNAGEGLTKRYDRSTRQLVLTHVPTGSEVFFNSSSNGDPQWQANLNGPRSNSPSSNRGGNTSSPRSSQVVPQRPSDLMESLLSDQESSQQPNSRAGTTLNDQAIVDMEDHYRKQRASELVANFPSAPVTAPRSQPLRERVATRVATESRVPPSFYRS